MQPRRELLPLAGSAIREHPLLYRSDGRVRARECAPAGYCHRHVQHATVRRVRAPAHQPARLQPRYEASHCLGSDEAAARNFSAGQGRLPRLGRPPESAQGRVLRSRELEGREHGVHREPQGMLGAFEQVAHASVNTVVNTVHAVVALLPGPAGRQTGIGYAGSFGSAVDNPLAHISYLIYVISYLIIYTGGRMSTTSAVPHVLGPDFVALMVRDLDSSRRFYSERLGLTLAPHSPPGAVVFDTAPVPFAVRMPAPGVDLAAAAVAGVRPGLGVALWLRLAGGPAAADAACIALEAAGVLVLSRPQDGPFGRFFQIADPDGYAVTLHAMDDPATLPTVPSLRPASMPETGRNAARVDP